MNIEPKMSCLLVLTLSGSAKNKFVETALQGVLGLARDIHGAEALSRRLGHGLDVSILGDNDFYSQRAVVSRPLPLRITLA